MASNHYGSFLKARRALSMVHLGSIEFPGNKKWGRLSVWGKGMMVPRGGAHKTGAPKKMGWKAGH